MPRLVVGTRLHLGNAAVPPLESSWRSKVESFHRFCTESCGGGCGNDVVVEGVIAVDATPRIPNYNLVDTIQRLADSTSSSGSTSSATSTTNLHVLPVTPWGKFVPALNALVVHAATTASESADWILFVSAELSAPSSAIQCLLSHMDHDTLVAGACLDGHDYRGHRDVNAPNQQEEQGQMYEESSAIDVPLDGRTCPWNTLAVWNLKKLALTGFQLVSDGLLTDDETDPTYGIEEVVAACLLQRILGKDHAKAKLVRLSGVSWDQQFDDPERKKWHEYKMNSKHVRAARQLELTGLSGVVHHC